MTSSAKTTPPGPKPVESHSFLALTPVLMGGWWLVLSLTSRTVRRAAAAHRPTLPNASVRGRQAVGREAALRTLADAIRGNSKQSVSRVLGDPRIAGPLPQGDAPISRAFWDADTWYYLIDAKERCGVVIEFINGLASDVQFLRPPRAYRPA